MLERLHKVLARAGVAALRPAEDMIMAGRVTVNGRVVRELGARVDPDTDVIAVDGQLVEMRQPTDPHRYLALYKPSGVVSTAYDPQGRPTVVGLVPSDVRLFPVGRLDSDSEGLILLTDDGDLAYRLTHPRFEVEKEYRVLLDHTPKTEDLRRWREGVELDDQMTMPAWVEVLDRSADGTWVRIVMREGRKRQIREVARLLGYQVLRLIRVREGPLTLGELTPGVWRELSPVEVQSLRAHTQHIPSRAADEERERRMADHDRPEGRRLRIVRGQRRPSDGPGQTTPALADLVAQARTSDEPLTTPTPEPPRVRRARVYQQSQPAARPQSSRESDDRRPTQPRAAASRPAARRAPDGVQGGGRQQNGYQPRDRGGYQPREQRDYQPRDRGDFQPRDRGDFQPRDRGDNQPRDRGDFQPRDRSDNQPRDRGDFQPRDRGDNQPREQREYQPRDRGETGGSYRPRPAPARGPQRGYGQRNGQQRPFDQRNGQQRGPAQPRSQGRLDREPSGRDYPQRSGSPYNSQRRDERGGSRNYDRRPGPPPTREPSDDRFGRAYDNQREPGNQPEANERGGSGYGQRPASRSPRDYAERDQAPRDRGIRSGLGGRSARPGQAGGARNSYGGRPGQRPYQGGADRRDRPAPSGAAPRGAGSFRQGGGPARGNEYDRQADSSGYDNQRSSGPRRPPSAGRSGPNRGQAGGFNRGGGRPPGRGPSTGRPGPGRSTSGRPNSGGRPINPRPSNSTGQRRPGPPRSGPPRRRDDDE